MSQQALLLLALLSPGLLALPLDLLLRLVNKRAGRHPAWGTAVLAAGAAAVAALCTVGRRAAGRALPEDMELTVPRTGPPSQLVGLLSWFLRSVIVHGIRRGLTA